MFIKGEGMVVALIGFAGALIPLLIYNKNRRDERRRAFVKGQRETYQEILKKVASVDIDLQLNTPQLSGLRDKIVEINACVLTHKVYLTKSDLKLVDAYLRALGDLTAWVQREGSDERSLKSCVAKPDLSLRLPRS